MSLSIIASRSVYASPSYASSRYVYVPLCSALPLAVSFSVCASKRLVCDKQVSLLISDVQINDLDNEHVAMTRSPCANQWFEQCKMQKIVQKVCHYPEGVGWKSGNHCLKWRHLLFSEWQRGCKLPILRVTYFWMQIILNGLTSSTKIVFVYYTQKSIARCFHCLWNPLGTGFLSWEPLGTGFLSWEPLGTGFLSWEPGSWLSRILKVLT